MVELPTWNDFLIHVLTYLSDGAVRGLPQIRQGVGELAQLTDAQRAETLPSGKSMADNRIGWALSYLARVSAVDRPDRGHYRITPIGLNLLSDYPEGFTEKMLRPLAKPGDTWWLISRGKPDKIPEAITDPIEPHDPDESLDPIEQIEQGLARIHSDVASDLLARLQDNTPSFFENAVVKLLVAMGYGGADGHATVTQQSNDGGIDGVIDQDALGLNRVYIQAKRYANDRSVQKPEVQAFVGALSGKATTGVFLTTGRFSPGAVEYARTAHTRIILIDGQRLTELMIRYGVGVQSKRTLSIVTVDEDFFE